MSKKQVVTYTFNKGALSNLEKLVDQKQMASEMQKIINSEIKPTIAKGISPVKGMRNFPKYKDKNKYPGDKKQSNKPNLNLTGEMLKEYKAKAHADHVSVGIHSDASEFVQTKAKANNFGTKTKDGREAIPARPFVPVKQQFFNAKINIAIRDAFARVLWKVTKSLKGK